MSKFNKELLEKLAELRVEREKLVKQMDVGQKRLVSLNNAIYGVEQLLHLEGIEAPPESVKPSVEKGNGSAKTPILADLIKKILSDKRFHATEELVSSVEAMGYNFGSKHPLRSVNFTLMGLQRGGDFERRENGWRYTG